MSVTAAYQSALQHRTPRLGEPKPPLREIDWQARWFSGACGREFAGTQGEKIAVLDFGEWNREAGPDFARCVVTIDGREMRGSVEIDLEAHGWEDHQHAINPAYENVVLHVIVRRPGRQFFSRTATHRNITQVCLEDHAVGEVPGGTSAPARTGRGSAPLRSLDQTRLEELLEVAARRRLEVKGHNLQRMISARGIDAALYESVAVALGYKNNKLPFQLIAQRVPLRLASSLRGEALLFGVAGFLERPEPPGKTAKDEVKELWADWWKQRAAYAHLIVPRHDWQLHGLRPANHPLRRLGALSVVARHWAELRTALESGELSPVEEAFSRLHHPFWSHHTTWTGKPSPRALALIGPDRIRAIYANVALPLALSRGKQPAWRQIPAGAADATLRTVTQRLFAGAWPRHLPRRLFVHQGLLQIYRDFCLQDHRECAHCVFPSLVGRLTA